VHLEQESLYYWLVIGKVSDLRLVINSGFSVVIELEISKTEHGSLKIWKKSHICVLSIISLMLQCAGDLLLFRGMATVGVLIYIYCRQKNKDIV